ncbi:hypothetical protein CHS0354_033302, partial [Potamilus streckersoni]
MANVGMLELCGQHFWICVGLIGINANVDHLHNAVTIYSNRLGYEVGGCYAMYKDQ